MKTLDRIGIILYILIGLASLAGSVKNISLLVIFVMCAIMAYALYADLKNERRR